MSEFDFGFDAPQLQDDAPVEEKTNIVIRIEGNEGALGASETATLTIVGDIELLLEIMEGVVIGLDGEITKVTKEY